MSGAIKFAIFTAMTQRRFPALEREDYEEILNMPTHLVVILSHEGKILKVNGAYKGMLGWEPENTIGTSIMDYIHEADVDITLRKMEELLSGDILSIHLSIRCSQLSGGYRWISWTGISKEGHIYAMGTDASQSIETENALLKQTILQKEYQTRFKTFFEQSTLPMEIYSMDGTPLAVNRAWEELFETTREQLVGYNVLTDPYVKNSPLWHFIQRAYQGDAVEVPAFWYEPGLAGKPGKARWLEAWISPVKDENGGIREIAMILKDVTEKIETQKALVKSISDRKATEEKFQIISDRLSLAVKAGNIGIWEWIPGTNYVYWDETTELIYGYAPGTFPRSTEALTNCIHPEDRQELWSTITDALDVKKSYRMDHRVIRRDGVQRWVQVSGMALYDGIGQPYHMMGTVIDITDRVEAEADQKFLSEASEFLTASMDYREIFKMLCDHATEYFCDGVYIDQLLPEGGMKRLMVVHPDADIVKKIQSLDEDFPNRYESNPVMSTLVTGKPLFIENADNYWNQLRADLGDDYYFAVQTVNLKNGIGVRLKGRESILGLITFFTLKDSAKVLTKRHIWLAEELAYRASMAFENALIHQTSQEAIRSRDEFLSVASHELKTPLQSLTLQNQMRKRNLDKNIVDAFSPDKVSTMIEADLRHLRRINRLIDDMLDISRIRAGKLTFVKERVEFTTFAKDVLERFRPQLEAVGCYMTATYCDPIEVNMDMYRVEQVIVNLLTNAMKYGAGRPIRVDILNKNDRLQVQVHDQGPGIKDEDTERIFERFERAISSNEVSGLGLGLYISRQIMEQNNGALFLRSSIGNGSTFIMELPCQ